MKPTLQLPREKIAELLQASGSTLTPEQYLASLDSAEAFEKFPSRARAAGWSKNVLIFVTILSALFALFDLELENLIIVVGLATVSFFETRAHRYFIENNPAAPGLGFRNQAGFAAGILIYGLYHAATPITLPADFRDMIDAPTLQMIQQLVRMGYLVVGIVGGISQFALAWYYRGARSREV